MTNAARTIWPNLQSDERPERQQTRQSLAAAMYGAKSKPTNSDRDSLLRLLKEANARIDARLAKERKR